MPCQLRTRAFKRYLLGLLGPKSLRIGYVDPLGMTVDSNTQILIKGQISLKKSRGLS